MINGAHVIIYSRDAEADRRFLRDVLDFAPVDAGDGWLVFKVPPAEVARPSHRRWRGPRAVPAPRPVKRLQLTDRRTVPRMCDAAFDR